ncbi:MAG: hypothetical protein AAB091_00490, partial [Elusimicrobiota bacterium]
DTTMTPGVGTWISSLWFFWEDDEVNSDDGSSIWTLSYNNKTCEVKVLGTSNGGHSPYEAEVENADSWEGGNFMLINEANKFNADGYNESLLSKCLAAKDESERKAAPDKTRQKGWGYFEYTGDNVVSNHGTIVTPVGIMISPEEAKDGDPSHYGFRSEISGIIGSGGYANCEKAISGDCKKWIRKNKSNILSLNPSASEAQCDNSKSLPCWYPYRPEEQKKNCNDPDAMNLAP